jgi:hypothetical protein
MNSMEDGRGNPGSRPWTFKTQENPGSRPWTFGDYEYQLRNYSDCKKKLGSAAYSNTGEFFLSLLEDGCETH